MTKTVFSERRIDPFSPPLDHLRLQVEEPVGVHEWEGHDVDIWTVAKYEDVRAVLTNTQFSSDRKHPAHPAHGVYSPATRPGQIISMDPPEHAAQRSRVTGEFTVKKVAALRPRVQEIVDELIDVMLAGPHEGDLVELLALPLPSTVIAEMLAVPHEDHDFFQRNSAQYTLHGVSQEVRGEAIMAIRSYIADLVDARIQTPGDDLLSRQLAAGASREEVIGLGFLLLIAGHETTSNMIALSIMTLLERPELLQQLRDEPTLIPGAVEELLRYFTIAETGAKRLALTDLEVRGTTIPAGSVVFAMTNTANRDPDVFPDPDRIDFRRGARNHLAFGFGPHQCLGQNVARLELEVVLETVIRRLPDLALAVPHEELPFKEWGPNYGMYALPVTW